MFTWWVECVTVSIVIYYIERLSSTCLSKILFWFQDNSKANVLQGDTQNRDKYHWYIWFWILSETWGLVIPATAVILEPLISDQNEILVVK